MYKELKEDLGCDIPCHGNLEKVGPAGRQAGSEAMWSGSHGSS